MDEDCYNVIVLGAGVQGSSTAYYLTQKAGIKKVLLLEQFAALHIRGSSHGNTRITRRAYEEAYYVEMMNEAFKMWSSLEKESDTELYKRTGVLVIGSAEDDTVGKVSESLKTHNIAHQVFSGSEANMRYPDQLTLPEDFKCVFEDDGGILKSAKALAAYQKQFVSGGGEFKDEHPVTEIIPGDVVVVKTTKGTFRTKRLVITAGAWAPTLLRTLGVELPFKVSRTEIIYWKVKSPEDFSPDKFPVFLARDKGSKALYYYGVPVYEYPGLIKICSHFGDDVEPDVRDANTYASTVETTAKFIEKYFNNVSTTPSIVEPCMYTESPTKDPVLDKHPDHSNIVIGAGFTGHGFKLSPVIGKVLSELVLDLPPSYDLSPFKLSRYSET